MKKLLLFTSMLAGVCGYETQAQDNKDFIQDALDFTTSKAGATLDSACFNFLGNTKNKAGAREMYILKLIYNSPAQGNVTKNHLTTFQIFKEGADDNLAGYTIFFDDKTRAEALKDAGDASGWTAGTLPEEVFIVPRQSGCPVIK